MSMAFDRKDTTTNRIRIEEEIKKLRSEHRKANLPLGERGYFYREFWAHVREINELFNGLKLEKEDREMLWKEVGDICEEVKREQNSRKMESEKNRDLIISILVDIRLFALGSRDNKDLSEVKDRHVKALKQMKQRFLLRKDRKECWDLWHEIERIIQNKTEELQEGSYLRFKEAEVSPCLQEAWYGDPFSAKDMIQKAQSVLNEIYVNRIQRKELRDLLNDAWDKATARIRKINEERRRKREEYRRELEERGREQKIIGLERRIEECKVTVSKLEANIEYNEEELETAATEEYEEVVEARIERDYSEIEKFKEEIREHEKEIEMEKKK